MKQSTHGRHRHHRATRSRSRDLQKPEAAQLRGRLPTASWLASYRRPDCSIRVDLRNGWRKSSFLGWPDRSDFPVDSTSGFCSCFAELFAPGGRVSHYGPMPAIDAETWGYTGEDSPFFVVEPGPRCQVCGHQACPCCAGQGESWCDTMLDGECCCDGECVFDAHALEFWVTRIGRLPLLVMMLEAEGPFWPGPTTRLQPQESDE